MPNLTAEKEKWSVGSVTPARYEHRGHFGRRRESFGHQRDSNYVLVVRSRVSRMEPTEAVFAALVSEWLPASVLSSSIHEVVLHPAYQSMIGIGRPALPLLLRRLESEGGPHWFWALRAISQADPANGTDTVTEGRTAWLAWGRDAGILD